MYNLGRLSFETQHEDNWEAAFTLLATCMTSKAAPAAAPKINDRTKGSKYIEGASEALLCKGGR